MTDKMYELHVQVPAKLLTPLIELLEGEGQVISVNQAEPESKEIAITLPAATPEIIPPVRRKRNELGLMLCELVVYHVAKCGGAAKASTLATRMPQSSGSVGGALSKAKLMGLVEHDGIRGSAWRLTQAGQNTARKVEAALITNGR